jgi:DNA-binding transcriptional ArsR family regulator
MDERLLETLKALSDASRLRIVGLLAARPMAVQELAKALRLSPGTVVHHLKRLREAGLVDSTARPPYMEYSLTVARLHEIGREVGRMTGGERVRGAEFDGSDGRERSAADTKVLRAFLEDGRLTSIPAQEKKRLVILRYIAETVFTEARDYPEKEVNQRLALLHPDVASLRRYLVDLRFMSRERGAYRLNPMEAWPA